MTSLFDSTLTAAATAAPVAPTAPVLDPRLGDDAWHAASGSLSTDVPVTVTDMVRPFHPWQASAYLFAIESIARWGGALIGDDMGMGKTAVMGALAADAIARTHKHAVVIAPPVTAGGWITELRATFPHLTVVQVSGHSRYDLEPADVYFVSDDSRTMSTWLIDVTETPQGKEIRSASPLAAGASIIVRDELHRDKGNDGKPNGRGKTMLTLGAHCRATGTPIVGATGTLLSNRMIEALIPLTIVGGEALVATLAEGTTVGDFKWAFCAPSKGYAQGGREYTKYGPVDTDTALRLHNNLRRTVYVRREKSDLGEGTLPDAFWRIVPLALPDNVMAKYLRTEKDFYNLLCEERGKVWADKAMRAQAIVQMNALRAAAGVAKVGAAADYIADLIADGKQVVAFYDATEVWLKLAATLAGKGIRTVTINGQVTDDPRKGKTDRTDAVAEFQAGKASVCIAQVRAAGIGVTLTAASEAVFIQTDWSAGSLKQCADRILRTDVISMARAEAGEHVNWHVLHACYSDGDETLDQILWSVLSRKAELCDAVNAGRAVTMSEESVQEETLRSWVPSKRVYGF